MHRTKKLAMLTCGSKSGKSCTGWSQEVWRWKWNISKRIAQRRTKMRCRVLRSLSMVMRKRISWQRKERRWTKDSWRRQDQKRFSRSEKWYPALQYAASFRCLVEDWKDCEELKPQPKDKWTFVDRKREETRHRTEWCACCQHFGSRPFSLELSVFFFVDTGLGVWFVVCLCCCRDTGDCLPLVCSCRDPGDCLFPVLVWSLPLLLSQDFRSGMVSDGFQTQRRVCGSQEMRGRKEFWQVRSRLMGERSGLVNSARSQMCGRGGVAGDATTTSQQGCVGSTDRWSRQGPENGQRALRLRAERKIGRLKVRRRRLRSFVPNLNIMKRRMVKEPREDKAFHAGEKVAWRKSGKWTLRMRTRAERSLDDQRRKLQKDLRDVEKLSCASKEAQNSLKNDLQQQLQKVEQRRHDLMPEHQITKDVKLPG